MGHMRDEGKDRLLTEYNWDSCFPGDELGFKWSVLVWEGKRIEEFDGNCRPK